MCVFLNPTHVVSRKPVKTESEELFGFSYLLILKSFLCCETSSHVTLTQSTFQDPSSKLIKLLVFFLSIKDLNCKGDVTQLSIQILKLNFKRLFHFNCVFVSHGLFEQIFVVRNILYFSIIADGICCSHAVPPLRHQWTVEWSRKWTFHPVTQINTT